MKQGNKSWTCSMHTQHELAAYTCSKDMQYGKCSMARSLEKQHVDMGMQSGRAARIKCLKTSFLKLSTVRVDLLNLRMSGPVP